MFPKALIDVPESELSEQSKAQRDKFLQLGHSIKHLLLLETGDVVFDPELSNLDALNKAISDWDDD